MSCINLIQIQQYIDNELSGEERVQFEKHTGACTKCSALLIKHQQRAQRVKEAMNTLVPNEIEVPTFTSGFKPGITRTLNIRKKIIYSVSAACIALLVAGIYYTLQDKRPEKVYMVNSINSEVNANLPVSQQEMIINVIDPEGNVTEYPMR